MPGRLGKGHEIFAEAEEREVVKETPEKTMFLIRPSERETLERFLLKARRQWRQVNNSMVVRCLIQIFGEIEVDMAEVRTEEALKDRLLAILRSVPK